MFFSMLPVGSGFVTAFPCWLLSSIFNIFVTTLSSSKMFFCLFLILKISLNFFRKKNFRVKCQSRIYAAKSTDKCLLKQVYNIGLYWERDDYLGQVSMDATAKRACRGTFSRFIWKYFHHFLRSVYCVLKIINVVQGRKFR